MDVRKKLGEAAESQMAGPFGKLGRYVLRRQGDMEVPPRAGPAGPGPADPEEPQAAPEGQAPGGRPKWPAALFRGLKRFLGW